MASIIASRLNRTCRLTAVPANRELSSKKSQPGNELLPPRFGEAFADVIRSCYAAAETDGPAVFPSAPLAEPALDHNPGSLDRALSRFRSAHAQRFIFRQRHRGLVGRRRYRSRHKISLRTRIGRKPPSSPRAFSVPATHRRPLADYFSCPDRHGLARPLPGDGLGVQMGTGSRQRSLRMDANLGTGPDDEKIDRGAFEGKLVICSHSCASRRVCACGFRFIFPK